MFVAMLAFLAAALLQEPRPAPPPTEILIVGTFHFSADMDLVKSVKHDVLGEKFQAQVSDTAARLAKFRPTKVVVEYPAKDQAKLDDLYAQYRAGKRRDSKSERDQLGARIAAELKLDRIYAFDQPSDMDFQPLMESAKASGRTDLLAEFQARTIDIGKMTAEISAKYTVSEHLAILNSPTVIEQMHSLYIWLLKFDTPDNRPAAALLTNWYLRNLNMFENLQRIAQPGDRVLILVGAGHTKHLRDLVSQDPSMRLTEVAPFLPPAPIQSLAAPLEKTSDQSSGPPGKP